ncbi:ribose 5-phosphate isomerase B [Desulfosporosinus orientis DSM 765]|uniref:Ribose 5-phosphate isomerase B n=1 Tax=Desulfosporosinus orientis (strain ATCC 19365 / DSM 765 / NCIMB 8382 / VKM B-1628 / Singapore I) TaxID=768706 RepID=G7WHI6_DESOD|nr:ribose 5-phosphate isomerase B [Desulfosporosinus orientis]AET70907.1 ribose 5-phosphate isomerase B [Desulfosporosinus orientis DSM 765]
MKVALGADHGGYELKEAIRTHLETQSIEVLDFGTHSKDSVDYPKYGFAVGNAILKGKADLGIVVCGTGLGISIAANKMPGIRAAVCSDTFSARMSREHNNANILALGARVIGAGLALDIVDIFLKSEFSGGRHALRVDLISDIERGIEL